MLRYEERSREGRARRPAPASRPTRAGAVGHPLLQLQRVAGNRAVARAVVQRVTDRDETDASDHGPDSLNLNLNAELVAWSELEPTAFKRRTGNTLFAVFVNLAEYHYAQAGYSSMPLSGDALYARYVSWRLRGVHTRAAFKDLLGLGVTAEDVNVQTARTGGTWSINGPYTGPGTGADYDNVIYLRDGGGNITFDASPTRSAKAYKAAEDAAFDSKSIEWTDPVDDDSLVDLSYDLKDKHYGLLPSGKKVKLKTATRSQHFAIADDIYDNDRTGKWTWHHLSKRYQMVLVDMRVHAKHGHNGGVYLW